MARHKTDDQEHAPEPTSGNIQMKINKSAKIRQMLEEMGLDASPSEVSKRLAEQGIDVKPQVVSVEKSKLKKKAESGTDGGGQSRGGRRTLEAPLAEQPESPAGAPGTEGHTMVSLDDVVTVREMTKKLGADTLKRLVDALGE